MFEAKVNKLSNEQKANDYYSQELIYVAKLHNACFYLLLLYLQFGHTTNELHNLLQKL